MHSFLSTVCISVIVLATMELGKGYASEVDSNDLVQARPKKKLSPLATDRPGNGNAASTIDEAAVVVETSTNYSRRTGSETLHRISFPTTFRFGLNSWLEGRIGSELAVVEWHTDRAQSGLADFSIGTKLSAWQQKRWMPSLAFLAQISFPSGAKAFSANTVEPLASVLAGWSLPAQFGLLFNFSLDATRSVDGGSMGRAIYLGLLSYTLPVLDDCVSLFVEGFGKVPLHSKHDSIHQVDGGIVWLITPDVQLDAFGQFGLNQPATDVQVALGLSIRWSVMDLSKDRI